MVIMLMVINFHMTTRRWLNIFSSNNTSHFPSSQSSYLLRHSSSSSSSQISRRSRTTKCKRTEVYPKEKKEKGKQAASTKKRFKCEVCSKTFKRRSYLSRHFVTHTSSPKFVCKKLTSDGKTCGRGFHRKDHFNYHMRQHSNVRPFACTYPLCGSAFRQKGALTRHKINSQGEGGKGEKEDEDDVRRL
eukprot:m.65210 g.65210  ORF g.65210 m.65210 type:complete len:188 (+) comp11518_c0_seq6:117-680(+)